MKYPKWAPEPLIKLHQLRLSKPSPLIARRQTPQQQAISENKMSRYSLSLPKNESNLLLKKLITNSDMEKVWKNMSKRISDDIGYRHFFYRCEKAIVLAKTTPKWTPAERKKHFHQIYETAWKLFDLMNETPEFDRFSIAELMDEVNTKRLLERLNSKNIEHVDNNRNTNHDDSVDYATFILSEFIPHIGIVILKIAEKAARFEFEEPILKKPNSENAELNVFIKSLTQYFRTEYGQPLYDTVATTSSVIFGKNVDPDLVRHITN